MPLLDVRKQFITFSGRYDLIVDRTTYANKGADFYIQSGQQYLDRLSDLFKSESRFYSPLSSSSWYVLTPGCRVVEGVSLAYSDGAKVWLTRTELATFRRYFNTPPASADAKGSCCGRYAVANLRVTPQTQGQITLDQFGPYVYNTLGDEYANTGILIAPATSLPSTLEVVGKFYQPRLSLDSDTSLWTEMFPFILVMAAQRALEISYRNTVGVKDWEASIDAELLGLQLDNADQESNFVTKFNG
jgi:hypothetical protein